MRGKEGVGLNRECAGLGNLGENKWSYAPFLKFPSIITPCDLMCAHMHKEGDGCGLMVPRLV